MREITSTVYQFSELSDKAKENARQWWRDAMDASDYSESVIEDAVAIAEILGIEIATRPVKLMGSGTRQDPCVYWSGFWSQGGGACFEGRYSYKKGSAKAIRAYAPQDKTLHAIADNLQACQRVNFYRLQAKMQHSGRYSHSGCMQVDVQDCSESAETSIRDTMRQFADWIYSQLQKECEYQTSAENIDDSMAANEYEFTVEGGVV